MNKNLFSVAAVFGAAMFAVPAIADEAPAAARPIRHRAVERAPVREAAPAQMAAAQPSWTGAQVGGQGGVSSMAQGFAEPGSHLFPDCFSDSSFSPSFCRETPFSFNGNKTSWTGGVFLGYRVQFGSVVAGIEGDYNAKNATAAFTAADTNRFRTETFTASASQGWDSSIRGRLGWLVTPWTMIYGTGGVAFGRVTGTFSYAASEIDGCSGSESPCAYVNGGGIWSTVRTGATAGAGVETLFSTGLGPFPSMTLRLEYRYTDLGNFSENAPLHTFCPGTCTSPSSNALINLHPTFQTVTVGVGLNF
jgi:outer membrane immunogenic protein